MSAVAERKRKRLFPLWSKQADFLDAKTSIKGFCGGIGSGKSKIGAYDLLSRVKPGRLYIVTAATYKVLRDATCRTFTEVARHCGTLVKPIGGEAFSARVKPFTGGEPAEVLFRSTENPDLLRGPNASGCWMDEASLSPYEAYQILIGRLREGGELGWLTATFTPKGRSHWSHAEVFGKTPPRQDVTLIQASTQENPFLDEAYLAMVEASFAGLLAAQELGGQFVSVEGAEWPAEYFSDSIWFDSWPEDLTVRTAALDPSKGTDARSGDYAAFVFLGVSGDGTLWVEGDLLRGKQAEYLAEQAVEHQRVFRADAFGVETNQFQQLLCILIDREASKRRILFPAVQIDNRVNKQVRIRRIGPYLFAKRVRFRDTPGTRLLVDQLREFPEGKHDDGPDAMEIALRLAGDLLAGAGTEEGDEVLTS